MIAALLGASFFAAAGCIGTVLGSAFAERTESFPDGPPSGNAPIAVLVVGSACIGAILATHAISPPQLLLAAVVCVALVAIWIVDAKRGVVPDVFTIAPLALLMLAALWQRQWWPLLSIAIPLVPFALVALLSRGRGMGWGDVKLVALGGAAVGGQLAAFVFAIACVVAAIVGYARGRGRGPIAFAPYLAAAIGFAIPVSVLR